MGRFPELLSGLFREFRNSYNEGRIKMDQDLDKALGDSNNAVNISKTAEGIANGAVTIANNAVDHANNIQEQFNQVIISGDSSVEAAQARVNSDGIIFSTLRDRLNDTDAHLAEIAINVKIFGAKGDGVTDDTTAIQNAINSLSNGGRILFPIGTYLISSPITLKTNIVIEGIISTDDNVGTKINYTGTDFCFKMIDLTGTYGSVFIKNIRFYSASGKGGFLQTGQTTHPTAGQETSGNCVNVVVEDCKIYHGITNPDTNDNSIAFKGWKCIGHKFRNVTVAGFSVAWDYQYSDLNLFEGCKTVGVLQFFKFNWLNTFGSQNHVKDCDLQLRRDASLTSLFYAIEDGGFYNRYTDCYFEPGVLDANGNPYASKPKGFAWITNTARSIVFQKCRFAVSLTNGIPNLSTAFVKVDGNSFVTFEDCDAEQPTVGQYLASLPTQKTIAKTSDAQAWIQGINLMRCSNNFISFFPVNNPYLRITGSSMAGYHFDSQPLPNILTPISFSHRFERYANQNGLHSFESNFVITNDINARDYSVWHLGSVQTLGSGNQLVINTPYNSFLRPSTRYRARIRVKPSVSGVTTLKLNVGLNLDGTQQFTPVNFNTDAMNAAVYQDVFINFRTGTSAGGVYKLILQSYDTAGTSTWIRISEIEIIELPKNLAIYDTGAGNIRYIEVVNGVIQLNAGTEALQLGT